VGVTPVLECAYLAAAAADVDGWWPDTVTGTQGVGTAGCALKLDSQSSVSSLGEKRPGVDALFLAGDVVHDGRQPLAVRRLARSARAPRPV
jgi:hypothetical protein